MSVTRITPWAVNGPTTSYGLASNLSGTATNVPAGALIVTSVQSQSTTQPTVSDTAGNIYAVEKGGSDTSHLTTWVAYCLSAIANSANVVTWSATSAVLTGAQGEAATTSSGTWAFDKVVGGYSAYATALSLSISTTGAGLIYGGFGEYETGPDVWTVTGLTAQASQPGSSTGTGNCGCLLADDITSGAVSGLSISVTDQNGTYGGYIVGVVGSFVVSSGGNTATGSASLTPTAQGSATATNKAVGAATLALAAAGTALAIASAVGSATVHPTASGEALATNSAQGSASVSPTAHGTALGSQTAQGSATLQPAAKGSAIQSGTNSATGSATLQPSASGSALAHNPSTGSATLQPSASGAAQASNPASGQASIAPTARGQALAFLPAIGQATLQPTALGNLSATNTALGSASLVPTAQGTAHPPFVGYPVDPNFYILQAPRGFEVAMQSRIFEVALPPRSFYVLDQPTMPAQIFLGVLDPAETKVLTIDGTASVPSGVTYTAIVGSPIITVVGGSDPNVANVFTGAAINTAPIAASPPDIQVAIGANLGVQIIATKPADGASYEIRIPCQTSQSNNVVTLKAIVRCAQS